MKSYEEPQRTLVYELYLSTFIIFKIKTMNFKNVFQIVLHVDYSLRYTIYYAIKQVIKCKRKYMKNILQTQENEIRNL